MRPWRHVLCLLVCAGYLPVAALPCPTPGLDRARPAPRVSPARNVAETRAAPHAGHAHAHAVAHHRAEPDGHAAHHAGAGHADTHGDHETHASGQVAKRSPQSDATLEAPCGCGCGSRTASTPSSARLGPVIVSASPPALPGIARTLVPTRATPLVEEPFRALDPVPI